MQVVQLHTADKEKYSQFVFDHVQGNIHQTWEWALFQSRQKSRDHFWILGVYDEKKLVGTALIIRHQLPFQKCWLYCPRGPLFDYSNEQIALALFQHIAQLAKQQHALFLRFDPALPKADYPFLRQLKARIAHANYQPEHTLIVDLRPSLEETLKHMSSQVRYNIKFARNHGVTARQSDGKIEDVLAFYKLLAQTTERDKFSGHDQAYYQKMLEILGSKQAQLYLAEAEGTIIAGAIVTFYKQTATYYYAASSSQHRKLMAPYLLLWQTMHDAQTDGYKFFDLFGIAPDNEPDHPWAKLSVFKKKFRGEYHNYLQAHEIIYQPFWYTLLRIRKWLRRLGQ